MMNETLIAARKQSGRQENRKSKSLKKLVLQKLDTKDMSKVKEYLILQQETS